MESEGEKHKRGERRGRGVEEITAWDYPTCKLCLGARVDCGGGNRERREGEEEEKDVGGWKAGGWGDTNGEGG